jgi:DNA-binding MarR family transcriptional regulator
MKLHNVDGVPLHAGFEFLLARMIHDFMHSMHAAGLSGPQIHALLYIYHAGECTMSEISELAGSSRPAASQLVERLVQQELVERTEDPIDRRHKRLKLTRAGLGLIQKSMTRNSFLQKLWDQLDDGQRLTVQAAFGYLLEAGKHISSANKRKLAKHG